MKKIVFSALCALALFSLSPNSFASDAGSPPDALITDIRLNAGVLSGTAGEYVYDPTGLTYGIPGYKVSQLDWTIENIPMIGFGLSISPSKRVRFNADYQTKITDGESTMDDYDWLYVGADWSHWSHHDNTTVNKANNIDVNAEITLFQFNRGKEAVTLLLGYKESHIAWNAVGGYGIYSVNTYRDTYFTINDVDVISYEQIFKLPYIGLGIHLKGRNHVTLTANVRYSNIVYGEGIDYHHLRNLRFDESGENGTWLAFDLKLGFQINSRLTFDVNYALEHHREIKTTLSSTDLLTGIETVYPKDSGGIEQKSSLLSAGISYRF